MNIQLLLLLLLLFKILDIWAGGVDGFLETACMQLFLGVTL